VVGREKKSMQGETCKRIFVDEATRRRCGASQETIARISSARLSSSTRPPMSTSRRSPHNSGLDPEDPAMSTLSSSRGRQGVPQQRGRPVRQLLHEGRQGPRLSC
jgi:hypothetical protein